MTLLTATLMRPRAIDPAMAQSFLCLAMRRGAQTERFPQHTLVAGSPGSALFVMASWERVHRVFCRSPALSPDSCTTSMHGTQILHDFHASLSCRYLLRILYRYALGSFPHVFASKVSVFMIRCMTNLDAVAVVKGPDLCKQPWWAGYA